MNNVIYFIDSNTPDIQTLIAGLPVDSTVVILQANTNGLKQIAAYLQENNVKELDAIQLFSHGKAGELYLGNATVTTETLNQNADLLAQIGQSLSATGDILLYGCNVAQDEIGQNFVNTFANLTGVDIAASDDLTGSAALGGDWDLEVQNGVIDAVAIENLQYASILKNNGTIASITPDTGTAGDFITSATTLTFAGLSSGPAGTVMLYDGGTSVGDFIFTANGMNAPWSIVAANLTEGSHTFTFREGTKTAFATKTVVIDTTAPTLTSLVISNPSTEETDADTLVYRATFDAAVANVDATDFSVTGTTATVTGVSPVSAGVYDVTVSGGDLENLNGSVSLGFSDAQNITDVAGNVLVKPTATASYTLVNTGNVRPTLSAFELITGTTANSEQTITFDNLKTAGDEADSDGTVTAFVIATVSSGTLRIGASSETATAWEANVNDVVDGTHNIYWTPSINASGTLNAFTVIAKDNGGLTSATPIQATVSITTENKAPVLTQPSAISYVEVAGVADNFANTSGTLSAMDEDTADTLVYSIISGVTGGSTVIGETTYDVSKTGTYGTLYVQSTTGNYSFLPNNTAINVLAKDATQSETFAVTVNDGFGAISQNLVINLTGANDAPILNSGATFTGTFNATAPMGTVGTLVSNLVSSSNVTDVDSGALYGLALTGTDTTHGTWYYSINGGTDWANVGSVSTTNALLLSADANTHVYFKPNSNFIGSGTFDFKAWDRTAGDAGTKADSTTSDAFSLASKNASVTIAAPTATVVDINFNSSTAISTVAPNSVTQTPNASYINIRATTDTLNTYNSGSQYQRLGSETTANPFGTSGNFLVLGDATGQLTNGTGDNVGIYGFAVPFTLPEDTTSLSISFDWVFNSYLTGGTEDRFVVGIKGENYSVSAPLTVSNTLIDHSSLGNSKYTGTSAMPYTVTAASLGNPDANGKYWLSFGLDESSTSNPDSAVGMDNIKIIATLNPGSAVTLSSFSTIRGNAQNAQQIITFADLITAGDEASKTGVVNAFVIKAISTGTLKIGTTLETATDWAEGTNDIIDATHHVYWIPNATGELAAFTAVAKNDGGASSDTPITVTVNVTSNQPAVLTIPTAISYTEVAGVTDSFSNATGTLSATDDGDTLVYGIDSGVTGGATVLNDVTYDVFKAGIYGTLYVKSTTGEYVFVPNNALINTLAKDATQTETFAVTVNDGLGAVSQNLVINLTGANDAPVLNSGATFTGTFNATAPTGTVGTLVSNLINSSNVTDVDSGALYGLAITGNDTTHGTWYYSENAGSTWNEVGAVSTTNALLLAADTNTRVYFKPNAGFIGSATFDFKAWDRISGDAGTKVDLTSGDTFSLAVKSASVSVTPAGNYAVYNDTAAVDTFDSSAGNFAAGKLNSTLGMAVAPSVNGSSATFSDVSFSHNSTTYILSLTGKYGSLYAQTSSNSDMGSAGIIPYVYVPDNSKINALSDNFSDIDQFNVTAVKRPPMNGTATADSLKIYVKGANDSPALTGAQATLAEGVADSPYFVQTSDLLLGFSDIDTGDVLSVADLTSPNGTITANTDGWTFTPNANYEGEVVLNYRVVDSSNVGINATQHFQLTPPPVPKLQNVQINKAFHFSNAALAQGNSIFSVSGLPAWLSLNTETGFLSGKPTVENLGVATLSMTASDIDTSTQTSHDFKLVVTAFVAGNLLESSDVNETIRGGTGIDTVTYYSATQAVTVSLTDSNNLVSIENLIGTAFNDALTGNAQANVLDGGTGADTLAGLGGNDTYVVDNAGDVVIENTNAGVDIILALVDFTLPSNVEKLTMLGNANLKAIGNALNNLIIGNDGDNTIISVGGADTLQGGLGDDLYEIVNSAVRIIENTRGGIDSVKSSVSFALPKEVENLELLGNQAINATGNSSHNYLKGNDATNDLNAKAGNDTIEAGKGADWITTGSGKDVVVQNVGDSGTFTLPQTTSVSTVNFDVIVDFSRLDRISLPSYQQAPTVQSVSGFSVLTLANNGAYAIKGIYDDVANTFASNATGSDTLLVYDADSSATQAFEAIVLLSYNYSASSSIFG